MALLPTLRRATALIAAYALALQPLVATLAYSAHATSLVPEGVFYCQAAAPGGSGDRGQPARPDRVDGCCPAAGCQQVAGGMAKQPRSITAPMRRPIGRISAPARSGAPQSPAADRYRSRAPPAV